MPRIYQGGVDLMNAFQSGTPHPGTVEFIANQWSNVSNNLTEIGRRFQEKAMGVFERANSSEAMRMARAATRRIKSIWNTNEITALLEIGDLQHASLTMQRWIMAEPETRARYHEQRLDGYNRTYVDLHPGDCGERHYDYRRVMDGIVTFKEPDEEGECSWTSTTYMEDLLEGDSDLDIDQQLAILRTHERQRVLLAAAKEDFTSELNADMG